MHKALFTTIVCIALILAVGITSAAERNALLVTQSGEPVNSANQAVKKKLAEMGFKVTVVEDAKADKYDPADFTVIIVSSTTSSGEFVAHKKFLQTATPTLSWEAWTYDDYGLCGANSWDISTQKAKTIKIAGVDHPIVSGLEGAVDIYKSSNDIHACKAYDGVTVLATVGTWDVLFAVDKGTEVNGEKMPGKRVGFASWDNGFDGATDASWQLFENAINWLTAD